MNNINLADLRNYLNTLISSPTEKFHYALFDIESKKVLPGCSYCEATIESFISTIQNAGSVTAHLVLNETDGKGRKVENITGVRAFLVDLDREVEYEELQNLIKEYKPSMVVESSPKKYHFYWDIPQGFHLKYPKSFRARWLTIQRSMAFKMNGDTQCSLSRLIRMPGIKRVCKNGFEFIPSVISDFPITWDIPICNDITKLEHSRDSRLVRKKERERVLNISDSLFKGWTFTHGNGLGTPDVTLHFSSLENSLDIPKGMRNSTLYEVLREGVYRGVAKSQKELMVVAKKLNAGISEDAGGALSNDELKKIVESAFIRGSKGRSKSEKCKEVERLRMEEGLEVCEDLQNNISNGLEEVLLIPKNPYDILKNTNVPYASNGSNYHPPHPTTSNLSLINTIEPFSTLAIVQSVILKNYERIIRVPGEGVMCFNVKDGVWVLQGSKDGNLELTAMLREEIDRIVLSSEFKAFYGVDSKGQVNLKLLAKERERLRSVRLESALIKSIKESSEIRKVDKSQFDAKNNIIKCKNGVLDMLSGELREATPLDYLIRHIDIDWIGASTEAPRWEEFISQIFAKNKNPQEMINFIQMVFGYTLSGSIKMQTVFCHIGTGSNGKSTVMSALKKLSGTYGTKLGPQTLNKKNIENFERLGAKIAGFRCVIIDDIETGSTWNEAFLKNLTDGEIETRRLFNEAKVLKNYAKVHMGLNEFPKPETESEAFFRRVTLIPYDNVFVPNNQKASELEQMLKPLNEGGELESILAWAVKGYQQFSDTAGFKEIRPQEVDEENRSYQESMSPIDTFLKQYLREMTEEEISEIGQVTGASKGVLVKEIQEELRKWLREQEIKIDVNPIKLGREVKKIFRVDSIPIWTTTQMKRYYPLVWIQRVESQEMLF